MTGLQRSLYFCLGTLLLLLALLCIAPAAHSQTRPATLPATLPAPTRPALVIGINGITPPAGHALHVYTAMPDYWRGRDHLSTFVVDPAGRQLPARPGPTTTFLTNAPGVYTVYQVLNGQALPPVNVLVLQPKRGSVVKATTGPAVATAPKVASNTEFATGNVTLTTPVDLRGRSNIVWDARGTTVTAAGPAVLFDPSTSDITIIGLRVDSPLFGGQPTGKVCQGHGANVSFVGLQIGHVTDGVADEVPGFRGLYVRGAIEDSATCNPGRLVFLVDSDDAEFDDCIGLGSTRESDFRTTSTGPQDQPTDGLTRFLIYNCSFAQPPHIGKACVTIRHGDQGVVSHCTVINNAFSINTGGAEKNSAVTWIKHILVEDLNIIDGKVEIQPGASFVTFRGGHWQGGNTLDAAGKLVGGGECFTCNKEQASFPWPVVGITVTDVDGVNNGHCFANVSTSGGRFRPGDLVINNTVLTTPTPQLPFAKDAASQQAMQLGTGNVVVRP